MRLVAAALALAGLALPARLHGQVWGSDSALALARRAAPPTATTSPRAAGGITQNTGAAALRRGGGGGVRGVPPPPPRVGLVLYASALGDPTTTAPPGRGVRGGALRVRPKGFDPPRI